MIGIEGLKSRSFTLTEITEVVYQSIGLASVCWDEAGVFNEKLATMVSEDLIDYILEYGESYGA